MDPSPSFNLQGDWLKSDMKFTKLVVLWSLTLGYSYGHQPWVVLLSPTLGCSYGHQPWVVVWSPTRVYFYLGKVEDPGRGEVSYVLLIREQIKGMNLSLVLYL